MCVCVCVCVCVECMCVCVCVECVCLFFRIILYVNCFGRTVGPVVCPSEPVICLSLWIGPAICDASLHSVPFNSAHFA